MWTDKIYRIVLFGHRDFAGHKILEEKLNRLLDDLIKKNSYIEVFLGRNGEFDIYTATIIKRFQKALSNSNIELICVLPYKEKDIEYYEKYYNSVVIPECVEKIHPKGAITARNRWMVEQADLMICYVERESGGAYYALKYAEKLRKRVINLAVVNKENEEN